MLNRLTLQNFLIHKDITVDFAPGLNVLRGANEKGKSSIIEGLAYNWFGSQALSQTLDLTLNWDTTKKSSMKTISEFDGYVCTRGTTGAEITKDGSVVVTGQEDVTRWISNYFKLPVGRAQHITIAGQNEIRGVLSLGPTAATEFIEKLCDFSAIDDLISRAATLVPNGTTKPLELAESQAREKLELIQATPCPEPLASELLEAETNYRVCVGALENARMNFEAVERIEASNQIYRSQLKTSLTAEQLGPAIAEAERAQCPDVERAEQAAEAATKAYINADTAIVETRRAVNKILDDLKWLYQGSSKEILEAEVALGVEAMNKLATMQAQANTRQAQLAYANFLNQQAWWKALDATWGGTEESLQKEIESYLKKLQALTTEIALTEQNRKSLEGQIVLRTCPVLKIDCETLAKQSAEVNNKIQTLLEANQATLTSLKREQIESQATLDSLRQCQQLQLEMEQFANQHLGYVALVAGTIPQAPKWAIDLPPVGLVNVVDFSQEKTLLAQEAKGRESAQALLNLAAQHEKIKELEAQLLTYPTEEQLQPKLVELVRLKRDHEQAQIRATNLRAELKTYESTQKALAYYKHDLEIFGKIKETTSLPGLKQTWASAKVDYASAETYLAGVRTTAAQRDAEILLYSQQLKTCTQELQKVQSQLLELKEGNQFLKILKEARIRVNDLLWNRLLAGVSSYFSQIRGEASIVAKGPGGFSVNGKLSRPSGSTLDALGLALRIVIAKVFAATNATLILDEPSAGCDNMRTAAMTGTLLGAGFDQIILVTHKDVDEAGATRVIEL